MNTVPTTKLYYRLRKYLSEIALMLYRKVQRYRHRQVILLLDEKAAMKALDQTGIMELLKQGKTSCHSCGIVVDIDNIAGWIREGTTFRLFCTKAQCQLEMEAKKGA